MYENHGGVVPKEKLIAKFESRGYQVVYGFDMRKCYLYNGDVYTDSGFNLSSLDAFWHMNADEQTPFQRDLLQILSLKTRVVNDYNSFSKANDKMLTNFLLREAGIHVPPSVFIGDDFNRNFIRQIFDEWSVALVKPRSGHGGKGVMRFHSFDDFCDFYQASRHVFNNYYIEKYIDFEEHDYRAEVFNGKIIGTYCRSKAAGGFKTNVSSGGAYLPLSIPENFEKVALAATKCLGITTTIVDMILGKEDNKIYVLEVNPIMGIFVEAVLGNDFPLVDNSFRTDDSKIDHIVNYFDSILK